jgi:hypothetical protein
MYNFIVSFVCSLLLCCSSFAQITAVIDGPETAAPGDLVVLSGSNSIGEGFRWITPDNLQTISVGCNNDKEIAFATSKPGKYEFILTVAGKYNETIVIEYDKHVVTVTGTPPVDPPVDPPTGNFDYLTKVSSDNKPVDPPTQSALKSSINATVEVLRQNPPALNQATVTMQFNIEKTLEKRTGMSARTDWLPWRRAVNSAIKVTNVEEYLLSMTAVAKGL